MREGNRDPFPSASRHPVGARRSNAALRESRIRAHIHPEYADVELTQLGMAVGVIAYRLSDALTAHGWRPVHPVSPYGPAWTLVEILALRLTSNVVAGSNAGAFAPGGFEVSIVMMPL